MLKIARRARRLAYLERPFDLLGVLVDVRVLPDCVLGHAPGGYAPLSEFVGESPLPEMNLAHWLYSPLSLLLAAAFPDITRRPPRSRLPTQAVSRFWLACALAGAENTAAGLIY